MHTVSYCQYNPIYACFEYFLFNIAFWIKFGSNIVRASDSKRINSGMLDDWNASLWEHINFGMLNNWNESLWEHINFGMLNNWNASLSEYLIIWMHHFQNYIKSNVLLKILQLRGFNPLFYYSIFSLLVSYWKT